MRRLVPAGAALVVTACANESVGVSRQVPPEIVSAGVAANPHNVLSAVVSLDLRRADSAVVRFHLSDTPSAIDSVTAAVLATEGSMTVAVLGLLPDKRYVMRPVAYGGGSTVVGDPLEFATGTPPSDLPRYAASGVAPLPGYVAYAAGRYGIVIDNTGRVVWYRRFANGAGLSFMAQPAGRYVARPPTPDPTDLEPWLEMDPLGNVTRMLSCGGGLQPRLHDLILEPDGGYWILCDETRVMDLTSVGGVAEARVTGTVVQHVGAAGELLFQWSPFDHFAITDLDAAERGGQDVNWTHGNSIDLDADGNIIVSFRSLGEVTKINVTNGAVMWRMGGRRNQFTFLDSPTPAFSRQHSVRASSPGSLLLLDNLGDPSESRAERYTVDESARAARLARSYGSVPGVVTQLGGSVQSLSAGRTLVSYGTAGRVEEYDAAGNVMWRIEGNPGYVFRAQRIQSLYAPGAGMPR